MEKKSNKGMLRTGFSLRYKPAANAGVQAVEK